MNYILNIVGLAIDAIAAIVLWYDSQRVISSIVHIINSIRPGIGIWRDKQISESDLKKFEIEVQKSSRLSIRGFILLIIGFLCQLGAAIITDRK
jgi:hypothetical protein